MNQHIQTATRLLLGLMFAGAAIAGMLGKVPPPEPEAAQAFMGVLLSSGLLYLVKILELVCGIALLAGLFVPLSLLVLAPIIVNIAYYHAALDPSGFVVGIVLIAMWALVAKSQWPVLSPLLRAK